MNSLFKLHRRSVSPYAVSKRAAGVKSYLCAESFRLFHSSALKYPDLLLNFCTVISPSFLANGNSGAKENSGILSNQYFLSLSYVSDFFSDSIPKT